MAKKIEGERKALHSEFVPHVAEDGRSLTKRQRAANRAHGFNLDGSKRAKNRDGKKRADRTYRSLEQRQLDALAEAEELGERIQLAEFEQDEVIKAVSAVISSLRMLERKDIKTIEQFACLDKMVNLRAARIAELRAE